MELRQLRYFVAVAEELHFSRAARRLNITQPPLSLQIQKLESELGVTLLKRTRRSVVLTHAGEVLLEKARLIIGQVEQAAMLSRSADRGETGHLRVAFIPIALDRFIANQVMRFKALLPRVKLSLLEMSTNDQLIALRAGRLHVAFIQFYRHDLRDLKSFPVLSETYSLAIPEAHPLAKRKRIRVRDLEGVDLFLPPRSVQPLLVDLVVDSCRRAGFEPTIDYEVLGKHTALALVAAGLGVTLAAPCYEHLSMPGLAFRRMEEVWPKLQIRLVWAQREPEPLLARFLEIAGVPGADVTVR